MDAPASWDTLRSPAIDRMFTVLSDHHRRLLLLTLRQAETVHETELTVRGAGDDAKEREQIRLTHNHLPKLADAGYIEWDRETGEISTGPEFEEIEPLLEMMETHADDLPPNWP